MPARCIPLASTGLVPDGMTRIRRTQPGELCDAKPSLRQGFGGHGGHTTLVEPAFAKATARQASPGHSGDAREQGELTGDADRSAMCFVFSVGVVRSVAADPRRQSDLDTTTIKLRPRSGPLTKPA